MKKLDPEHLGKLLAVGGGILSLAVAAVSLLRNGQGTEDEEQEDCAAPAHGTKNYRGYVPTGCRACGGPYPMCRLGCPVFDED